MISKIKLENQEYRVLFILVLNKYCHNIQVY